ncbi:hypothetical protein JYQ62_21895 [Nostoc sp. UHCC 0702]|nr:hypothetical protein JYQ62_21895 [Nostoc sp. UHCC 0702]
MISNLVIIRPQLLQPSQANRKSCDRFTTLTATIAIARIKSNIFPHK